MHQRNRFYLAMIIAPALIIFLAFFILPMARLILESTRGEQGFGIYLTMLTTGRYIQTLFYTVALSLGVTLATLIISGVCGVFLQRNNFFGKNILIAMLTFPLAFPGVVVGFMIILLAGRQGLMGSVTKAITGDKLVLAYSMTGLFLGYLYFSIPRVITTIMAAAEKIDVSLEEAALSLGASTWGIARDILIPALTPGLISSGAICFATSMGAFGTAFTLATDIDVLPIVIYTEFTLSANIAMASALSILLGLITWGVLTLARCSRRIPGCFRIKHYEKEYASILLPAGNYHHNLRLSCDSGNPIHYCRNHHQLHRGDQKRFDLQVDCRSMAIIQRYDLQKYLHWHCLFGGDINSRRSGSLLYGKKEKPADTADGRVPCDPPCHPGSCHCPSNTDFLWTKHSL